MASDPVSNTTADDEFMEAFKDACSKGIVLGRRLKPRMITGDPEAASEFGQAMGKLMAEAGTTAEEATRYTHRILMMVLAEAQA